MTRLENSNQPGKCTLEMALELRQVTEGKIPICPINVAFLHSNHENVATKGAEIGKKAICFK